MYISTQTWSLKAIGLYICDGFESETTESNPGATPIKQLKLCPLYNSVIVTKM
ncbi:hypothetical protein [Cytobacillus purgationiresistens]|uniref:Uncharacterized protein n=1 Tax=Cytobacillus purgationiresistens TaxID=863449 RepID=A0ABU0ABB1_9BACI|nr:hypothetical protein [Cytobacillus purgationiresistens]MDQ0268539.1 hypothetical protein [Cytobacillus purgationiresistens]